MANAFRKAANFLGLVDDEEIDQSTPVATQSESRFSRPLRSAAPAVAESPTYLRTAPTRAAAPVAQPSVVVDHIVLQVAITIIRPGVVRFVFVQEDEAVLFLYLDIVYYDGFLL